MTETRKREWERN